MIKKNSPIYIVIASYYPDKIKDCINFSNLVEKYINLERIVFVNNGDKSSESLAPEKWVYLSGSNKYWEWSAWQEGLEYIKKLDNYESSGGVLFFNDTILSHRVFTSAAHLALMLSVKSAIKSKNEKMVGFKNYKDKLMRVGNHSFSEWVSSYVFFLNKKMLNKIEENILEENLVKSNLKSSKLDDFFRSFDDPVFADHLDHWLFKGGWYKSDCLNEENFLLFKKKTEAIIHEKVLSARASALGDVVCPFKEHKFLAKMNIVFKRLSIFIVK